MPYDLFLAHASAEKAATESLFDALSALGVKAFFDARSVPLGARWDLFIPRAQRDSRATVVLVPRVFDQAWYLGEEIATAIAAKRNAAVPHDVIPVFLDGIPSGPFDVPYGLRGVQGLDLPKEGGVAAVAARLLDLVASWRALPPPPPAPPPPAPLPAACERNALYKRLCRLLDVQFEALVLLAGLDRSVIAGPTAPLARRAIDVVDLVTQGGEPVCTRVCDAFGAVAPELR